MKRAGRLFDQIISWDNLRLGYYKASRGKRVKKDVLAFRSSLDENLAEVRNVLIEPGYPGVGQYRYFTIHGPKKRCICEAPFSERVLHHTVMNVLEPYFDSYQIFDSYACRIGKGTDAALRRALHYSRRYSWVAKCDFRRYFDSIDHEILKTLIARRIKDRRVLRVLSSIVDSYQASEGKGVPIGNLTSQFFANHYLSYLDHYAKEAVRVPGWIRYMDDMLFFGDNPSRVVSTARQIGDYASDQLCLEMKPPVIACSKEGVPFLGFLIRTDGIFLTRKKRKRAKKRIRLHVHHFREGRWSEAELVDHVQPIFAHLALARSRSVRNTLLKRAGLWQ